VSIKTISIGTAFLPLIEHLQYVTYGMVPWFVFHRSREWCLFL